MQQSRLSVSLVFFFLVLQVATEALNKTFVVSSGLVQHVCMFFFMQIDACDVASPPFGLAAAAALGYSLWCGGGAG